MKVAISILTLQEVIRKTRCDTLVNSGILEFKNGMVQTKGNGIEYLPGQKAEKTEGKAPGKIDGSLSFQIQYPTPVQEEGEVAIADLQNLLSKSEIFEKEDQVQLSSVDNKFIIEREIPQRILTYDIADKKFIETAYKEKQDVIFSNPIKIISPKGKEKDVTFTTEIILDASQLKSFADAAKKIAPTKIPLQVKEGKFFSAIKGTGSDMMGEIKADKVEGEAISKYRIEILEIFKAGFGLATLRFSENAPIHIHYELNDQKADYLLNQSK